MKKVERHKYDGDTIIATRTLEFDPFPYEYIEDVMKKIECYLTPDLLSHKKLKYPEDVIKYRFYGHCYHSSQALYYLMDTDKLQPYSGVDWREEKHWWLQDGDTIYDVTYDQYRCRNKVPPYDVGKVSKWYGWKQRPQQLTLDLMVKVLGRRLALDDTVNV